ncbi:hypothetical protein CY35_10G097200 [Sphagnum magellanicum]|nr:hypothetical protein CY35_10G097200 [Sphagnum magellanicum]
MTSALDMSLDDLIKNNKQVGRGGGGGGGGGGGAGGRGGRGGGVRRSTANNGAGYGGGGNMGPSRRQVARSAARPTPYATTKAVHRAPIDGAWQHDLYDEAAAVVPSSRSLGIETGTKLYISNLDYGVSNDDIKELFSEVGDLKRCSINYDRSGRSKGTAEVVLSRKADAIAALKRYNNVQLDGKPMKIELIGTNLTTPVPATVARVSNGAVAVNPGQVRPLVMAVPAAQGRGSVGGRRGGGGGASTYRGRGRGQGTGRGRGSLAPEKSVEDLDADLENYHAEAMQTN